jgi:flagellar biosynthetic protein FliP
MEPRLSASFHALRNLAAPRSCALLALLLVVGLVAGAASEALAQPVPPASPTLTTPLAPTSSPSGLPPAAAPFLRIDVGDGSASGSTLFRLIALFAGLSLLPAAVLAMTSFPRIVIVLSLVRQGLGANNLPPTRILVAIAIFMTIFTMTPVFSSMWTQGFVPWRAGQLDDLQALIAAAEPLKRFMLLHTREADLMLFLDIAGQSRPATPADVPFFSLVPSYILSEVKTGFQMGGLLLLPFLAIDLVVGSVLMSMGMMMLPPAMVAMPLKILIFVAVDGWGLVIGSLARSFGGPA